MPSVPSTDQGLKPKEKFDVGEASPTLMEVLELKLLGKCHFHLHPWDGTMEILGKCPWFLDSNFPSETYHHFLGGLLTASAVLSLWAVGTSTCVTWVLAPRSLGDCKGKRALVPGCGRAYDAIALAEYGFDRDWAALATAHVVAVVVCLGIDSGTTCWLNTYIYNIYIIYIHIYIYIIYIFQYKFAFVGSSVGSQFVLLQNTFV